MQLRRVAVLGGGPGGLYAARLLKLAQPVVRGGRPRAGRARHDLRVRRRARGGHAAQAGGRRPGHPARHRRGRSPPRHDDGRERPARPGCATTGSSASRAPSCSRSCSGTRRRPGCALEFGARRTADELDADVVVAADGVEQRHPRERALRHEQSRSGAGCTCGAAPTSPSTTRSSRRSTPSTARSSPTPTPTRAAAARS